MENQQNNWLNWILNKMRTWQFMTDEQNKLVNQCPLAHIKGHWEKGYRVWPVIRITKKYYVVAYNDRATDKYTRMPDNSLYNGRQIGESYTPSRIINVDEIEEFVNKNGKNGLWDSGWSKLKRKDK